MTKDDVDSFVVDMKTLASILGHNDDVIMEKFKDVFPDPNIEAALIAMDNFAAMQTKAKQLVHIYKPAHDSPMASAAILVHTVDNTPTKSKLSQPKSNQHQLAPINQPQENPNTGDTGYNCQGITWIHRSPSRPRPSVRPTANVINIHEHPL